MTDIVIAKRDNSIVLVESIGHTGYAEEGYDIVCAAVSSVLQTALLGLLNVAGIDVPYERKDGYLKFEIPSGVDGEKRAKADIILDTMLEGIKDLSQGLSQYIKLEVK